MLGKIHLQYQVLLVTQYLLAKQVQRRFSENKEIVLYTGTVVSQEPGFQDWYNTVYDDEPDIVYSYKWMEDYINGDLSEY